MSAGAISVGKICLCQANVVLLDAVIFLKFEPSYNFLNAFHHALGHTDRIFCLRRDLTRSNQEVSATHRCILAIPVALNQEDPCIANIQSTSTPSMLYAYLVELDLS